MLLVKWIINALAILLAAYVIPGITVDGFLTALIVSVVLGIINAVIKPILIILTLPINILTLGLFTFVINALLVLFADSLLSGFAVAGFWIALLFSLVVSVINSAFLALVKD
jgi:putative membrane protein